MSLLFCLNSFFINFMVLSPGNCSFTVLSVDDGLQTNLMCGSETLQKVN